MAGEQYVQGGMDFLNKRKGVGVASGIASLLNVKRAFADAQRVLQIKDQMGKENIGLQTGQLRFTPPPPNTMASGGGQGGYGTEINPDYVPPVRAGSTAQQNYKDKLDNAKSIADAIENGEQLADFKSLYGLAGPVKAELSRRGVDVRKLQLQATAETKLAQTLQGPQQVRLRQSIDSVLQGLNELESINQEFDRFGIRIFNKAKITALVNGAGSKEQQDVAQRFVTQMIGLQDEFGNVIMSGNSPTDQALKLAGNIFKSDYNNTSVKASISQARRLLTMRRTAIENVGVSGHYGQSTQPTQSNGSDDEYSRYLQSIGKQ